MECGGLSGSSGAENILESMSMKYVLWCLCLLLGACTEKSRDRFTDTPTTGVIPIAVDEGFEPILQQEADVFEGIYPSAGIVPRYCDEVEAVNLLLKDSVRLAVTTRRLTSRERQAIVERKFIPHEIKIAEDGIALIVNRQNRDSLFSVSDLQKIMTGEVSRWEQLHPGREQGDIILVFDHPNSSTVRFAIDSICRGKTLSPRLRSEVSSVKVIDYVAATPGAIGVVSVSWLMNPEDSTRLSFLNRVKVAGISRECPATKENSFLPWQAFLALGDYPLKRDVYVLLTDPRFGLASGFTSFLTSDRGQRIILKSGILPATQPVRVVNVREEL